MPGILKYIAIATVTIAISSCSKADDQKATDDSTRYQRARETMVVKQIETRGITDRKVLAAMRRVKRHLFVLEAERYEAYYDYPLPIGENQTISQPYIVALMTELLDLDGHEKVLEIGTGSGYQAAILGEIADSVFTIEIIPSLAERAQTLLAQLNYDNVLVKCGDGFVGWEEHAPYEAIMVTCAPAEIPQPLLEQLADSGRLVIPVGTMHQELMLVRKIGGEIIEEKVIPVRFVPMTGQARDKK